MKYALFPFIILSIFFVSFSVKSFSNEDSEDISFLFSAYQDYCIDKKFKQTKKKIEGVKEICGDIISYFLEYDFYELCPKVKSKSDKEFCFTIKEKITEYPMVAKELNIKSFVLENEGEDKQVVAQSNSFNELYCINRGLRQRSLEINSYKCPSGFQEITKTEFLSFPNLPIINEKSRKVTNQLNTSKKSNTTTQQVVLTSTKLDKKSLKEELAYWKGLFEDELITQAEYDAKRKELLSGASVTTTTTVAEPKVEKKKVVAQTTVVENNTNTIDLSFKDKNYINRSLLDKMGFFSNDGKIKDYCEDKYPKLHVYMECYAQNVKKYRNYKRAAAVYDLYIDYGRYLAWEAMIGNMSESSARYQLSAKRKELGDAYAAESRDKWNRIADSMEQLRKTHESFQPKPLYGSGESTNVCMYNAEKEAMKICRRKLNNGTCAQFSFEGC